MKNKLFIIGLSLALAVCINVYAKDGDKEGSLTITGIPAEYNGKFATFSHRVPIIASTGATDTGSLFNEKKTEGTVITNGEVKLLLFKSGMLGLTPYTDSKTVLRIELCIRDTAESSQEAPSQSKKQIATVDPDFIFPSITFKDGVAAVKLDDAFKVGIITVTGIPSVYNGSRANIRVAQPDGKGIRYYDNIGEIKSGTLTVKYYRHLEKNYMPYTGTADVTVTMGSTQSTVATDMMALGVRDAAVPLKILFKAQLTNDSATLNLTDGIKQ